MTHAVPPIEIGELVSEDGVLDADYEMLYEGIVRVRAERGAVAPNPVEVFADHADDLGYSVHVESEGPDWVGYRIHFDEGVQG
jgi:hypothetical protein